MKKDVTILLTSMVMFALASCSSDTESTATEGKIGSVAASTVDYTEQQVMEEETRSTLTYTGGSTLQFAWGQDDKLAVFTLNGTDLARFTVDNSTVGSNFAKFTDSSFQLEEGGTYYAFSPQDSIISKSNFKMPVLSYACQRQTTNTNTAHLGAYDYQVAIGEAADHSIDFGFKHLGAILHFKITVPAAGKFDKLEVRRADGGELHALRQIDLTDHGQTDMSSYHPSFEDTKVASDNSTCYTLMLGEKGQTTDPGISLSAGELLHAFIMIPASSTDLAGKTIYAILKHAAGDTAGKDYYCSFSGKATTGGFMYGIPRTAVETSVITENIEVYKDWQNGYTATTTRATGDPGTTQTLDRPQYLTIYTCIDGVVKSVYQQAKGNPTSASDWTETTDCWKFKTIQLDGLTASDMPKDSLHVYAVASNVAMEDINATGIGVGSTEEAVRELKFTSSDQTVLCNTYTVPYSSKDFGLNTFSSGVVSITPKLYHVASKMDINWDSKTSKVTSVVAGNLLSTGYLFRPVENSPSSTTYSYTLPDLTLDQQYYGRKVFYTIQQKADDGYFHLNLKINGSQVSGSDIILTPSTKIGYTNCTSWFRVNVK